MHQEGPEQHEKGYKEQIEFLVENDENQIVDCLESISEKVEVAAAINQIERSR